MRIWGSGSETRASVMFLYIHMIRSVQKEDKRKELIMQMTGSDVIWKKEQNGIFEGVFGRKRGLTLKKTAIIGASG